MGGQTKAHDGGFPPRSRLDVDNHQKFTHLNFEAYHYKKLNKIYELFFLFFNHALVLILLDLIIIQNFK